ncbi:cytochrome c biogenesis protein CcsA [Denitrificimonas sp. JX-1]|uniref:Cytochrome c biogenesis protein CcsA n=1 Tax=Denitrificimonas halotolerans TaxID=3098930 RepID=A0ABU5GMR3_9GAMM|nr:cytochrome c biogenesis protein CcsA [Denitrificimonas sp. JX-1]MDY7218186.1 cytochrome c biogenesis protein CcsA [Denitrificimonas sp. JX-1]
MSSLLFSLFAAVFYGATCFYLVSCLGQRVSFNRALVTGLTLLGFIGHGGHLFATLLLEQGLVLSLFNSASLIAFSIIGFVLLCLTRISAHILLLPLLSLGAVTALSAQFLPHGHTQPINEAPGILAHILFSILAYGMITIALFQSIILLVQERQLRKRPVSTLIKNFPPLQSMESLLFGFLWAGWLLLSLSLLSGWLFLDNLLAQHLVHKTLLSCIAWFVFGILLWGRHQLGWRGHKAIRWTIMGFLLLMLAYFGSKLVREFILVI